MSTETEYKPHPAAELFPMMPTDQYEAFKEDIRRNGFQQDIVLYKGQILDGRNRYKAAIELNMLDDLPISEIDEDYQFDPYQWVISRNLHRRHLNESQRALVAAKLAKLRIGEIGNGRVEVQICTPTLQQAAEQLDVGRTTVAHAKTVLANGSQELIEAVEQGKVAVSKAAKIAKGTPKEEQVSKAKEKPSKPKKPNGKQKVADSQLKKQDVDQEAVEDFLRCRSPLNRLKKLVAELTDQQKTMLREYLR
jgi:ParB-like chromosome segregation protein Spo0J